MYLYFCKGVKGREILFIEPMVGQALLPTIAPFSKRPESFLHLLYNWENRSSENLNNFSRAKQLEMLDFDRNPVNMHAEALVFPFYFIA